MAKAIVCDVCETILLNPESATKIHVGGTQSVFGVTGMSESFDLCPKCMDRLLGELTNKRPEHEDLCNCSECR